MPPRAAPVEVAEPLAVKLQRILATAGPHTHIGLHVTGVRDGVVVFEHRAEERFVPASTLKLLTGAAALYYLGPAHRFATYVLVDELMRNGKVAKNLYLRGSGDPSLSDESLNVLAASLKQQGVASISGDIIVDDSIFDPTPWGKGWMWDDLSDGFSAPVSGLSVAHNEVAVSILPGAHANVPAHVSFSPTTPYVLFRSSVTTGPVGSPTSVHSTVLDADPLGLGPGQTVVLTGSVPQDGGLWTKQFAVRDGALFAGVLLREHLRNQHIECTGTVRRGVTPPTAFPIGGHVSRELTASLIDFMKASNNHGMESLLKRMGANTTLQAGNWPNGVAAVKAFLAQQVGMDVSTLGVVDGSGISRYSLVTPAQFTHLLRYMYRNFSAGAEFVASLPIGGLDGTLSHRFSDPALHGRVRAKTGTMTGVSNLAGYVLTGRGDVFAFAFMIENFTGGPDRFRRLQEEVLLAIAQSN